MWTILVVSVVIALAIMGGFNTLMDFCVHVNSLYKSIKERRKAKLLAKAEADTTLPQVGSVGRRFIQGSYTKKTKVRPLTLYDIDIISQGNLARLLKNP